MATDRMIEHALDMFAATFNKKDPWQSTVQPIWTHGLKQVKDKHLWDAMMRLCQKKHKYVPTLGHVIEEVQEVIRELGGTGTTLKEYKFCENCISRDGVVEISAHFIIHETGKTKIHNAITRCTCEGGSDKFPQMKSCEELYKRMEHDGRITLKAWYQTDAGYPYLPMQVREPHNYQKMLQYQSEAIEEGLPNPYMEYAQFAIKMSGGVYVPKDVELPKPVTHVDKPTSTHYTDNNQWTPSQSDRDNCPF